MSTLAEIEAAADALPREEQGRLLRHIAAKLALAGSAPKQSVHDLMKHGCGIVDSGVTDLATNKEHLRDYGR